MEIVIKNGLLIDGSGTAGERVDILIKEDKIVKLGNFKKKKAELIIDAADSIVAPGFIDINNDSDHYLTIFTQPEQESLLKQGITTIIGGNCGSSLAPLIQGNLKSIRKWTDPNQINIDWQNVGEFLNKLEQKKIGVNFGTLIGHSTVRRGIIGDELRDLNEDELEQMKEVFRQGLNDGAFGISSGLEYSHARLTPINELLEILKILKKYNGLYATHLRSEKENLLSSISELQDLAEKMNYQTPQIEISHLKSYRGLEEELNLSLAVVQGLKEKGVDINFDSYPYQFISGPLYLYLPDWAIKGGLEDMMKNIKNDFTRKRIIEDLKKKEYDYSSMIIMEMSKAMAFVGKSVYELARMRMISPEEMMVEIMIAGDGRVIIAEKCLSRIASYWLFKNSLGIIASNGEGLNYADRKPNLLPHPRSFGAFPKFLAEVRDNKLMDWPTAIKKITAEPARKLNIKNRGLIKKGFFADLVVFNPININSSATIESPYQSPQGIDFVIVNGQLVINKSQFSGIKAGRVLRKI
jgi:N-acyl-D-amino-acid deacylase